MTNILIVMTNEILMTILLVMIMMKILLMCNTMKM